MNWFKIAANVPYVINYDWDSNHRNWLYLGIGPYKYLYEDVNYNVYENIKDLRDRYLKFKKK